MKKKYSLMAMWLTAAIGLASFGGAHAASTWTFQDSGSDTTNPGNNIAKTSYTSSETTLNISGAYSTSVSGNATWNTTTSTSGSSATLVIFGGGLGMNSDGNSDPNHAIDNNGNTEAVLLSFGKSVILTSVDLGWYNTDSDMTLFRYTGTSTPPPNLNTHGSSLTSMTNAGWQLVGNYANVDNPTQTVNTSNLASSWWLLSAYNPAYGGNLLPENFDYMKILSVTTKCATLNTNGTCGGGGTPGTGVPEPASLALVAVGLLGVVGVRRRQGKMSA